MRYCDFSKAKVGDEVYNIEFGLGQIIYIDSGKAYPLKVKFSNNAIVYYTYKGQYVSNENCVLFWQPFEVPEKAFKKPLPDLKVDTPIWVWGRDRNYRRLQAFSNFDDKGNIWCFSDGYSSDNHKALVSWDNWELVK